MKTIATCSGLPQMSGNVRRMSVNSFDSGCASTTRSGYASEVKFGYCGPTSVFMGTPSAARFCRSWRKSSNMTSRGHVAGSFRGSVRCATMLGAYMACWLLLTLLGRGCCGGGRFGSTALLCPLSSIKSTPRRSSKGISVCRWGVRDCSKWGPGLPLE